MVKEHYRFPKIRQYHQVIQSLKLQLSYVGNNEAGDPIYKEPDVWPTIDYRGTVKLHGTNSAIVFSADGSFYCQSRERVIDEFSDNAGFAHWVNTDGHKLFDKVKHLLSNMNEKLVIFGEWCGGSIQAGVALNQLPKMFVIFGVKYVNTDNVQPVWLPLNRSLRVPELNIYNVYDCGTYFVEVDLNKPELAIETMTALVDEIDKVCPFGKMFGIEGHGEGIVFGPDGNHNFNMAFKVKGASHSKSKIKKLPTVDVQKVADIRDAVESFINEDRLEQMYGKIVLTEADKTPQNIGPFIKALIEDVWEEEGDAIRASDISLKEFSGFASKVGAKWFQQKIAAF